MTHEWVEQEKKRLAEKFNNYPQRLLDEWYAIPEEYRDVRLKKYNLWPEIANIEASIREGSPVNQLLSTCFSHIQMKISLIFTSKIARSLFLLRQSITLIFIKI